MKLSRGLGRRARLLVPVVIGVGLLSTSLTGASGASVGRAFTATAEASGMYLRYSLPGFLPVEDFVDSGGPVAQAVVGSDGGAQAFSSLPYPGSTAVAYPGVFALVTEGAFVPPGYPFYVYAAHPTHPEGALADPSGAYSLKASAKGGQATGESRVAPPGGDAVKPVADASSNVVHEGDQVTASALSLAEAISVGPLSLGVVRSRSVTTYQSGDARPTSKTELSVEGGRAGDTSFSFGPQGLQVAKQGIPVPAGQGLASINQTLTPAGLSINFSDPKALEGGEQAAALEITSVAQVPGAGVGTLRARLGGAMSFISLGPEEANSIEDTVGATVPPGDTLGSTSGDGASPSSPAAASSGDISSSTSASLGEAGVPSVGLSTADSTAGNGSSYDTGTSGDSFLPPGPGNELSGAGGSSSAGEPTAAVSSPGQLAMSNREIGASSNLALLLIGAVMAGLGLLAAWLWTKRGPAWTL